MKKRSERHLKPLKEAKNKRIHKCIPKALTVVIASLSLITAVPLTVSATTIGGYDIRNPTQGSLELPCNVISIDHHFFSDTYSDSNAVDYVVPYVGKAPINQLNSALGNSTLPFTQIHQEDFGKLNLDGYVGSSMRQSTRLNETLYNDSTKIRKYVLEEEIGLGVDDGSYSEITTEFNDVMTFNLDNVLIDKSIAGTYAYRIRHESFEHYNKTMVFNLIYEAQYDIYQYEVYDGKYIMRHKGNSGLITREYYPNPGDINTFWWANPNFWQNIATGDGPIVLKDVKITVRTKFTGQSLTLIGASDDPYLYKVDFSVPLSDGDNTTTYAERWRHLNRNPVNVENISFTDFNILEWVQNLLGSIFNVDIFMGITIGSIVIVIAGVGIFFFLLRLFAGG